MERGSKMNIFFKFIISILFIVSALSGSNTVYSADKPEGLKMGVVDVTRVTRGSLLAKDIARQIDAKRRKFMNEIKTNEAALRALDDELQKKRVILSRDAFAEEKRKFIVKRTALNRMVQARNQELLKFRRGADLYWNKAMQKALIDVVRKYRFNFVFRYTPELILVRPDKLDISNLVLDKLNKNISKYTITPPAAKSEK